MGPLSDLIAGRSEVWKAAVDSINILVWIPILMIAIILALGWKDIREKFHSREQFVEELIPHFSSTGGLLIFVFAASNIISKLGLSEDIVQILNSMSLSKVATVVIILILVAVVAGPSVFHGNTHVDWSYLPCDFSICGYRSACSGYCYSRCGSTEGASPPASGALFVACGLTGMRPAEDIYAAYQMVCSANHLYCSFGMPRYITAAALRRAYEKNYIIILF